VRHWPPASLVSVPPSCSRSTRWRANSTVSPRAWGHSRYSNPNHWTRSSTASGRRAGYTQHHVRVDTDRDFNVADNTDFLQQQSQSIKFLSMFILAIAAISLFVGGVGVANIMLVAVTERTREIGIRKAIGAPRRAIMRQFLSEAVMLTALGGLVGSVFGVGLCLIGKVVIPKLWPPDPSSLTPTPVPLLSLWPVLIAFGVSLVIGLLAGGYPAYRAARLRPIEALRFE
jgi:putative ABC transport system permease protein